MTVNLMERKPKSRAGKIYLREKEGKLIENDKKVLIIRGDTANLAILKVLKDLHTLKQQNSTYLSRKNQIRPFENPSSLEFLSLKNDSSLFVIGNHSKKRPNNIVLGRLYDNHILDMFEFGVIAKYINEFNNDKILAGVKPILIFNGMKFDSSPNYQRIKNLFIDFFKGPNVDSVAKNGIEHILSFTLPEDQDQIFLRSYKISSVNQNLELEEVGPRLDLTLRRISMASDELFKKTLKVPKQLKAKSHKNISYDEEGTRFARIHMKPQNLNSLKGHKIKGLHSSSTLKSPAPARKMFKSKTEQIQKLTEKIEI